MDLPGKYTSQARALASQSTILVIGMGNRMRGDGSAGQIVASEIGRRALKSLRVCEHTGDGASLIALWEGASIFILVDAIVSGAPPGTIHRLDAIEHPLPGWQFSVSTHSVGLAEAIQLARVTKRLPERLVVYGIEGRVFDFGSDLSIEVRNVLLKVVDCVVYEVQKFASATQVRSRGFLLERVGCRRNQRVTKEPVW
jgi:hydrogenase maturation protease